MKLFRELNEDEAEDFRQWARDNYCPCDERSVLWHPVVHEEMVKIDREKEARGE
jgi:hypothetical protein